MGSATGGTGGDASPPTKKLGGDIMSYIPPYHDGPAVTVIIPAMKRALRFNACLFLAVPTDRFFTIHENYG